MADASVACYRAVDRMKAPHMTTEIAYALGYTNSELERLTRQANLLAPCTERLFRAAGIGHGHRVLELGSGGGDVSILLAELVGRDGEVVGIEQDAKSIGRARRRIEDAGTRNVSFREASVEAGLHDLPGTFDAVVGRFILMYVSDPVEVLKTAGSKLRPAGVAAFLEPSWASVRGLGSHLPLYSACAGAIVASFAAAGANPEMGPALHGVFQKAGFAAPHMTVEILMGASEEFARAPRDILMSLNPDAPRPDLGMDRLGDLNTLSDRLHAEILASQTVVPWLAGHVGAWAPRDSDDAATPN